MTKFHELRPAVSRMLSVNLGVIEGESVAFVTDIPSVRDWETQKPDWLAAVSRRNLMVKYVHGMMKDEFPGCILDLICYPMTGQNGKEPSLEIAERLLAYDVIVMMTTYSLSHTRARENACIKGTRVASMPEVEEGMFAPDGPMAADYQAIAMETMEIAKILTAGNQVRITTPFGTDLSFSIAGRMGESDSGILVQKGQFGNLPGGEAYIAPVEGTASGTLVVPEGWYPGLDVEMRMTFIDGYVSDVSGGGDVGIKFADIFAFHDEGKKHRRNCAELGVGTNPNAKRPDNVLEAEKIKGTVHVAVGDSSHLGGHTESDLHEDFVLAQPSVWIDGKKFIE